MEDLRLMEDFNMEDQKKIEEQKQKDQNQKEQKFELLNELVKEEKAAKGNA